MFIISFSLLLKSLSKVYISHFLFFIYVHLSCTFKFQLLHMSRVTTSYLNLCLLDYNTDYKYSYIIGLQYGKWNSLIHMKHNAHHIMNTVSFCQDNQHYHRSTTALWRTLGPETVTYWGCHDEWPPPTLEKASNFPFWAQSLLSLSIQLDTKVKPSLPLPTTTMPALARPSVCVFYHGACQYQQPRCSGSPAGQEGQCATPKDPKDLFFFLNIIG